MLDWLEVKYTSLIAPFVEQFKPKSSTLWNFRCPFCGDSAINKHKSRGYLYPKEGHLRFKCFNCGTDNNFGLFLKNLNQALHSQYKTEKFKSKKKVDNFKPAHVGEVIEQKKDTLEHLFEPLSDEAIDYLKSRKVDKTDDIWFTSDMSKFAKFFPDKELPKDKRIIFPIRNRKREVVGLSARTIDPKNKMRYVLLNYLDQPLIFGLDKVDIGRKVYVVEGAIDSLHLNNAVAVNGSDLTKVSEFIPKKNQILIFDNQPRNKQIILKMLKACQDGYSMIIWPKNLYEKDINAMVNNYGMEMVNEWLTNVYSGLKLRAKIVDWKRV
jgi:predicted RNA-binding Zn-ribbon protein involved in translation (DUF1610 family)